MAKGFADYRLDNVANTIYDFVWNEFCDWYLEIAKVQIQTGNDAPAARHAPHADPHAGNHPAPGAPDHPVHHRRTVAEGGARGRARRRIGQHRRLPAGQPERIDEAADAHVARLKSLVDACRTLRGEMNVSPATRLPLYRRGRRRPSCAARRRCCRPWPSSAKSRCSTTRPPGPPAAQAAPVAVVGEARLCLHMEIDVAAEKARLAKEVRAHRRRNRPRPNAKLGNEAFVAKAPPP